MFGDDLFSCVFVKQKTAYERRISDWSSDVCSSDLRLGRRTAPAWRLGSPGKGRGDDTRSARRVPQRNDETGQNCQGWQLGCERVSSDHSFMQLSDVRGRQSVV